MKLVEAIEGYILHAESRPLSKYTIADYTNTFAKLTAFLGDGMEVGEITKKDIEAFLNHSRDRGKDKKPLSKKTLKNYHTGLSAFWTWLVDEEIVTDHIVRRVKVSKPEHKEVIGFSEQEVKLLLGSLERSKPYRVKGTIANRGLQNRLRNRMIILLLLDTGMRASELCSLKVSYPPLKAGGLPASATTA